MTTATQLRRGGAGDGRCDVVEAPGDQAADVAADSAADNIGAQPDEILNRPLGLSVTLRAAVDSWAEPLDYLGGCHLWGSQQITTGTYDLAEGHGITANRETV